MTVQRVREEEPSEIRRRLYRRASWIAVAGNALLAAAKGAAAWASGSSAVFADAANSLSDTLYSLLMAVGLYLAQQPPDRGHPQGHSRFEPLVSLLIAVAMVAAGVTAARESVLRLLSEPGSIATVWPTAALLGGIVVKVAMYAVVRRIGDRARSPAVKASARDNLADVLTSGAALIGVWGARLIHPLFDPVAGILVSLWIFRAVWEIVEENLGYLTGRAASPELHERIVEAASQVPGVLNVHQVIADHVGPEIRADIHVDVDGEMTLRQAHAIADRVEEELEALPEVDLAFVHLEPVPRGGESPQA